MQPTSNLPDLSFFGGEGAVLNLHSILHSFEFRDKLHFLIIQSFSLLFLTFGGSFKPSFQQHEHLGLGCLI